MAIAVKGGRCAFMAKILRPRLELFRGFANLLSDPRQSVPKGVGAMIWYFLSIFISFQVSPYDSPLSPCYVARSHLPVGDWVAIQSPKLSLSKIIAYFKQKIVAGVLWM